MSNVAELLPTSPAQSQRYGGVTELSVDHWITVPDNPRQRDTETRARRAKHLREPHPTHCLVNMARLPDGTCRKLDGHTRAYLWQQGTLERPAKVFATIWHCSSIEDVKALYGTFDSTDAVETVGDRVFGAVREHEIKFDSELLGSLRFASGMRVASDLMEGQIASRSKTIYEMVDYWLPELRLLDECRPSRKRFHTGVMAAALLTFRRYGPEASNFWKTFAMGAGTKINGDRDAIQALEERMEYLRSHQGVTGRGNANQVVRICLSAFDAYRNDYTYTAKGNGIKSWGDNTFDRFIAAAAKTMRRW